MIEIFAIIILVLLSASFSGLTLGYFSLNITALENKMRLGDKRAIKIYPIRKNSNLLLCTLLLGNVTVNTITAVIMGNLASGLVASITATAIIFIFGEITPQAVFSRHGLKFGASLTWLVRIFIFIFYPFAAPMAFILDKILGKEPPTMFTKEEFQEIIKHHEDSPLSDIDADEEKILIGALSFSHKTVLDIMTPRTVVYTIEATKLVDTELLLKIRSKGFSRIPVYLEKKDNLVGILYSKDLIGFDLNSNKTVGDLCNEKAVICIDGRLRLDEIFNLFIKEKRHLAFVIGKFDEFKGIVTLEDVIEEILKTEIVDEADKTDDMRVFALKGNKK